MSEDEEENETPEVQVYHFDSTLGSWEDHGCGFVTVVAGDEPYLEVVGEGKVLLHDPITADTQYTIEGESGITFWSKQDNVEKALSFDQDFLCQRIREKIAIVAHTKTSRLPEDLTCEGLKDIAGLTEQLKASIPTLSSWVMQAGIIKQLLSFFHWAGKVDPEITCRALHTTVLLIHSIVTSLLQVGSVKILAAVTADVSIWLHYLMLVDYVDSTAKRQLQFTSENLPASFTGPVSIELLSEEAPPWTSSAIKWVHTLGFGAGLQKHKTVGKFKSKEVNSRIHQTGRANYWIEHMIIPESVNSVPIPSAQPCSVTGGAWEACIVALKGLVQQNQVVLVSLIVKDSVFLSQLFKAMATQQYPQTKDRYMLLSELFMLGEAALPHGVDLCTELARHGLFVALFKGLDQGGEEATQSASLLEYSVGGGPKPCTDGSALKTHLALGGNSMNNIGKWRMTESKPDLFISLAKACVDSSSESAVRAAEHVIDILDKILTANYARVDNPTPAAKLSELDVRVLDCVVKFVLPYLMEHLACTSAGQCYDVLSLLGRHLERESAEICELDSQWRALVKMEVGGFLVNSAAFDPNGCLACLLRQHASRRHIAAAVVRLHRCILLLGPEVAERYRSAKAYGSVMSLFLAGDPTRSGLLNSSVLGMLSAAKAHSQLAVDIFRTYHRTVFSQRYVTAISGLREFIAEISDGDKSAAEQHSLELEARKADEVPAEIEKALSALATVESLRTQLLSHYLALCDAAGQKPQPPQSEIVGKPTVMAVHNYSEVFAKVDLLAQCTVSPTTIQLESPPSPAQRDEKGRKESEQPKNASPLLRKDSLMFTSKKHRDKAKPQVAEGDPGVTHHPQPPRRKNSFGRNRPLLH